MDWKSDLFNQLKTSKNQYNIYDAIIQNYNHLLETNIKLLNENNKLGQDVQHLRLANAGLEKASEASQ